MYSNSFFITTGYYLISGVGVGSTHEMMSYKTIFLFSNVLFYDGGGCVIFVENYFAKCRMPIGRYLYMHKDKI